MKLFSAKNKAADSSVQTSVSHSVSHPFMSIDNYSPYAKKQFELYESLREAVPVIDAAISKITRLLGTFTLKCSDKRSQKAVDDFLDEVRVNNCSKGFMHFLYSYFDQLLTFGTAVGEMVISKDGKSIVALYNASLNDIELKVGSDPLVIDVYVKNADGSLSIVKHPEYLNISLLNPEPNSANGTSILKGLPFVSSVLLKIFNTIGVNFERVGNVRFAVTYNPTNNSGGNTKQRVSEIANQWSKAMRDKTQVCDFVSVGDVSVKVIGADNQVLSCDIEVRHLLEQIVSKLCIPPFLLGLSWSSTERMSTQQADILTSELEYYRTILNPVIRKTCKYFLRTQGLSDDFEIQWSHINLLDETSLALARLNNAQAAAIENTLTEVNE
ncbi:MAG: serine/threonine protein phosphatase [Ruminococcus sp.]|nr:serine/threonine protein phosphatase [Ruminococcus sp.]